MPEWWAVAEQELAADVVDADVVVEHQVEDAPDYPGEDVVPEHQAEDVVPDYAGEDVVPDEDRAHPLVEETMGRLGELRDRPVGEHAEVYADLHERLQSALVEADAEHGDRS